MKLLVLLFAATFASSAATVAVGVGCDMGLYGQEEIISGSLSGQGINCADPEDTFNAASAYASLTESNTQIALTSSIGAGFIYLNSSPSGSTYAYANITEVFTPAGNGSGYLAFGGSAIASDGGLIAGLGLVDLSIYVNGLKVMECADLCTNPIPFSIGVTLGMPISLTIAETANAGSSYADDTVRTALTVSAFAADSTPETLSFAPEPRSIILAIFGVSLLAALQRRSRSTNPVSRASS